MARADHLQAHRGVYTHDGIDEGNGFVIHFTSAGPGAKAAGHVQRTTLAEFAGGDRVTVVPYAPGASAPPDQVIDRARSMLGRRGLPGRDRYDLVANNCEHFARFCKTGDPRSEQVLRGAGLLVGGGTSATLAFAGLGLAAAATGAAVGLSGGAATTSTLAAVGAGSAVVGSLALTAIPAATAVIAIHAALQDDVAALPLERAARAAGRRAAIIAALLGIAAAGATIYFAGRAGFDAAGITSALRATGSLAGGGMQAGIVIIGGGAALAVALCAWRAYVNAGGGQVLPLLPRS